MKKLISLLLASFTLNAQASHITQNEYAQAFKHYKGCFILYSVDEHKILTEYNPNARCNQRIAPDSTFKIPLSLMGFNEGIINQHSVFKWDGKKADLPGWNQDQSPQSWLTYSVLWVSQQLTPQLGYSTIKQYLARFEYGNQDFSGDPGKHNGLTRAWLSSSLKISANEQLHFLLAMLKHTLPINKEAIEDTKRNMYLGKLTNGAQYFGKTGSGIRQNKLRDGWFIGFIEKNAQQYIFVSNLTDQTPPSTHDKTYGSVILKPITLALLNKYFAVQKE